MAGNLAHRNEDSTIGLSFYCGGLLRDQRKMAEGGGGAGKGGPCLDCRMPNKLLFPGIA